jgi:hypothetical protein
MSAERAAQKEEKKTNAAPRADLTVPQSPDNAASPKLPVEGGYHPYPKKSEGEPPLPKP